MKETTVLPTEQDVKRHFDGLHADLREHKWQLRMMRRFGYFSGEAWYEATIDSLVKEDTSWLDVGGGKTLFPSNERLSRALSERCALLVGVDPSPNINGNPYLHERANCAVEEYNSERKFDLATLQMVAEHVREPRLIVESLARLIKPGGRVVVYTPSRWSPVCIAASLIPFWLHKPITCAVWGLSGEDTFRTFYRMNTRNRLRRLFQEGGFKEIAFARLDNCTSFRGLRVLCFLDLCFWWVLHKLRLKYPISELLGVYERVSEAGCLSDGTALLSDQEKHGRKREVAATGVGMRGIP
jgi:SAM-dependent methyltransferase